MTTLQDKTPEELTRMLAECLGWKSIMNLRIGFPDCMTGYPPTASGLLHEVPPYATSYDAIMPEILRLEGRQREDFCKQLERIRMPQWRTANFGGCGVSWLIDWALITASPADLTRALILVLQNK